MLEHEIYGTGNQETILLIHGALVTQSMWKNQVSYLRRNFKVITCNLPEHGGSSRIKGRYTVEALVGELRNMIAATGVESMSICGHSLGGMVAQYFTYSYPKTVERLILAETAFSTKSDFSERIMTSLSQIVLRLMSKEQIVALSAGNYGNVKETTSDYVTREMGQYDKKEMLRVMSAALNYNGKKYLDQIKVPTLILVGRENKTTHQQARQMNEIVPDSKLVFINRASHLLNLDNSDEFNERLINFISTSTSPNRSLFE